MDNTEQALAHYAIKTRAEIEHLSDELLAVVQETMQPEQVSLWLKGNKK